MWRARSQPSARRQVAAENDRIGRRTHACLNRSDLRGHPRPVAPDLTGSFAGCTIDIRTHLLPVNIPGPLLLSLLLSGLWLSGCATNGRQSVERNREIVGRYFDRWANHGDTAVADELIASDLVLHNPPAVLRSLDDYKRSMAGFHAAFPDLHFTAEDLVAEGDRVVVRWTLRGTQRGEFLGRPPTGRTITVTGMSLFRIVGGRIQEIWVNMDRQGLMEQLGPAPAAAQPAR